MGDSEFRALVTEKTAEGTVKSAPRTLTGGLPEGDVTVGVAWAGFNYKDGLCLTGRGGLVRDYPHVGGIDFAGHVIESADARYTAGQNVLLHGWKVGERHWGGFSQRARVNADWLVPLPEELSARDAMVLGTAGFTAELAIARLEANGLMAGQGEVLVTGAGGGVGSLAVMLLAWRGYAVAAVTGRAATAEMLQKLGAATILDRSEFAEPSDRILESGRWAGVIDNAGGPALGRILKQVMPGGGVASIGNAGGADFAGSVIPFILRGVSLYGIESSMQPFDVRKEIWARLAADFSPDEYAPYVEELRLEDLPQAAERILKGEIQGRAIVNVGG